MSSFHLRVLASDKPFYDGDCESLIFPTLDGLYGIQAHHTNMIAAVVPGTITIKVPEKESVSALVSSGLIKIEDGDVLILVDTAEAPEEVDINLAKRAEAHAKEAILQKKSIQDMHSAQVKMARALKKDRRESK